ncbi:hypothetical protein [Hyphomicrobium sp. 2TAF46]|uniref:hypothetical protein n=1 Tax=Hyphomicrobium sp. 2TAF46 TaxID=3233019 RepID=UPI003F90C591
MKTILKMRAALHDELMSHLLKPDSELEQAAFVFLHEAQCSGQIMFEASDVEKLSGQDFDVQAPDYLELADSTRTRLIKKAHDAQACLLEMHSHPGPWRAGFSASDRLGLRETVPHMWWRLKKRPYLAIVVAASGFDALVWYDNPKTPRPLDALMAGDRLLKPTNFSLGGWS